MAAHPGFSPHTGCLCVSPPLQMIHGRTTESPSAKPWDCFYVSEDFNSASLEPFRMSLWCEINTFGLLPPTQITSWSTPRMTQSHSSSSLRCPVLVIFLLFMCAVLLFHHGCRPCKGLTLPFVCLLDDRSSAISCSSAARTRKSSTRAGRASLLSRSPWKTGWVRKARLGRWLPSVWGSQQRSDSCMLLYSRSFLGKSSTLEHCSLTEFSSSTRLVEQHTHTQAHRGGCGLVHMK